MTLYSLIELETAFSPFVYLTLSLSLVFVTSVVALLLTHCVECLQAKKVRARVKRAEHISLG